ncbi:MAG: hypothetical protein AB1Z98_20185 [Nannocystaceae bacterium]
MGTNDQGVMSRWMRESTTTLHQLRQQRAHHEQALEEAMDAIRQHTQSLERVERDIEVIETAMACVDESAADAPDRPPARPPAEDEFEVAMPTEIRRVSAVRQGPPQPPPLRPVVPLPRAVGHR